MVYDYSVEKPLNREPPLHELIDSFITERNGYDRNHGPIPHINADDHSVRVDGCVKKPLRLSISQLKSDYDQHEIISALQCAGNRRHTMRTLLKEVTGIDWGDAAVMNCKWKGPRLKDVLNRAGVALDSGHVAFSCYQAPVKGADWYGGSIELDRAMRDDADVLLAMEMNGKPLSINHGYPVRVIVPGVAGCRSVKWLDQITVQAEESTNLYQRLDYKILPPEAENPEAAKQYWAITPALQDMPINSVIAVPETGQTVHLSPSGTVEVRGYALPRGAQGPVTKVEVSNDGGQSWEEAEIVAVTEPKSKWCWSLWKATVCLEKGRNRRLLSRATDKGGNVQKASPEWNLRGFNYNGYGEARDLVVQ